MNTENMPDSIDHSDDIALALTWTPKPLTNIINEHQHTPRYQLTNYINLLRRLRNLSKKIIISPELHVNGTIHFHITIWLLKINLGSFYKSVLPSLKYKGFVCVKKIDDLKRWVEYCLKDTKLMEEILECKLPITEDSNILQKFRNHTKRCKKLYKDMEKGEYKGNIIEQCANNASEETGEIDDTSDDEYVNINKYNK